MKSIEASELKFIRSCKAKRFKRFILESDNESASSMKVTSSVLDQTAEKEFVSLSDIIMQGWTGT